MSLFPHPHYIARARRAFKQPVQSGLLRRCFLRYIRAHLGNSAAPAYVSENGRTL